MSEGNVRKWCSLVNGERIDVQNEARYGRPSVVTEDLKASVDSHVPGNRRFIIDGLHEVFP
jgi:hypothetical protein